jgi:hypothetical protein
VEPWYEFAEEEVIEWALQHGTIQRDYFIPERD